mmetsp:Transcript_19388/g.29760  ORF Transcript_19388/g.29760 Transcript_19388/m.29760 type:complete len:111 (-) Transcript_19388:363-695(-)
MGENQRADNIKQEKFQLMETRKTLKKEAEIQKHHINEAFHKMKIKGKFDKKTLGELGINLDKPDSGDGFDPSPSRQTASAGLHKFGSERKAHVNSSIDPDNRKSTMFLST